MHNIRRFKPLLTNKVRLYNDVLNEYTIKNKYMSASYCVIFKNGAVKYIIATLEIKRYKVNKLYQQRICGHPSANHNMVFNFKKEPIIIYNDAIFRHWCNGKLEIVGDNNKDRPAFFKPIIIKGRPFNLVGGHNGDRLFLMFNGEYIIK